MIMSIRRGEPPVGYYTAAQAKQKLGDISDGKFRDYINKNLIERFVPPGGKQGFYTCESVDTLVRQLEKQQPNIALERRVHQVSVVSETDWVRNEDLPYLQALDFEMYGPEDTVPINITSKWWNKNPYMCRILFNRDNRKDIWGAITIMPMKEETIFKILRDEIVEKDIKVDDILSYETGHEYYGYIPSAMVRSEHQRHFRKLIESVFEYWCGMYPDIRFKKLYAFAASDEGLDLMRHLFFSPRYDLGDNAFELDPYRRNPSKIIKQFQNCLGAKQL